MSDFSYFSLFTAGLACLVPFASAYTKPVGAEPKGNPISEPGLNSVVPAGKPFSITWQPTTTGTVTLVLLKGPSTNAVPQYAIVEKIDNDGSYVWTPSTDLAPGQTGYGIQLIDDENGQYQYTTQFGISNPDYNPSSSSSSSSSSSASSTASMSMTTSASASSVSSSAMTSAIATANGTSSASIDYVTEVVSKYTTFCPYATSFSMGDKTYTVSSATTLTITDCPCTITKPTSSATAAPITASSSSVSGMISSYVVASTGGLPSNGSIIHPTGSMTVPSTLKPSASAIYSSGSGAKATGTGSAPIQTGAASTMATSFAGLVVAAGVAVFAL